jgi:hypothetical protein
MKRMALLLCAVVGLLVSAGTSRASWGAMSYSGYQPWWNIFAKRYKCLTPEEERLQKFWHDYYDAMQEFYCALDHIDWVAYYKNHGCPIGGGGPGCGPYNCGRVNYAPVFVTPTLQWATPPGGPGGPGPMGPGPMGPGPMGHGPMGPGQMGPGPMGPGPVGYGPGQGYPMGAMPAYAGAYPGTAGPGPMMMPGMSPVSAPAGPGGN